MQDTGVNGNKTQRIYDIIFTYNRKTKEVISMKTIIQKNKEIILYLICGALAFFLSVALFTYFHVSMKMNELIANVIAWCITVIFAFLTNKIIVFADESYAVESFIKQFFLFAGGRLLTLVVEEMLLYIMITRIELASVPVKILAQIIVIVLNYIISKCYVFTDRINESVG